jgi:hypothetical protein
MSDEILKTVLPALDLAAFQRRADGTFTSLAPRPAWFARLVADPTFPFLGHILEEATAFWNSGEAGRREWGPVAEVDDSGSEFHYRVTALTSAGSQFLVFQLDLGADQVREVLQKVRTDMLAAEQRAGSDARERKAHLSRLRRSADAFGDAILRGVLKKKTSVDPVLEALTTTGGELLEAIDDIVQATRPARR